MFNPKSLRDSILSVVLVALVAALLYAAPALFHPGGASAQGVTCGGTFYPNVEYCGTTGSVGTTCNGVYYATETSCPSNVGVICGGIVYPSGQICGNTGSVGITCNGAYFANLTSCPSSTGEQSCPDGSLVPIGQSCPSTTFTCPNGTVITTSQSCPTTTFTCPDGTVITTGQSCPTTIGSQYCNGTYVAIGICGTGSTATYPAGWDLVGGPTGTILTGASGSIYTLSPGSGSYLTLPAGTPLQGGSGYWAYFPISTTVTLATTGATSTTVSLPAGPFVMIGNPSSTTVNVSGYGAEVLVYQNGTYSQTSQLLPGQGAWAASATGGQLSIGNGGIGFGPSGGPPPPPPPL